MEIAYVCPDDPRTICDFAFRLSGAVMFVILKFDGIFHTRGSNRRRFRRIAAGHCLWTAIIRKFRALIAGEGLAVNDSKTDTVPASKWNDHVVQRDTYDAADSFGSLISRLQIYCARSPEKWEKTKRLFRDSGFSLPLAAT